MITRRDTLETIVGAAVIGSASGCTRLATRRTTHFRGTPAMVHTDAADGHRPVDGRGPFAAGVGITAHRTVERSGLTRQIVAHSWGLLYTSVALGGIPSAAGSPDQRYTVATVTTPSVRIAGRELNPITDRSVADIARGFLSITRPSSDAEDPGPAVLGGVPVGADGVFTARTVRGATAGKVIAAFRDGVSIAGATPVELAERPGGRLGSTPDWNGDRYGVGLARAAADSGRELSIRFGRDDGDFVMVFVLAPPDAGSVGPGDGRHPGIVHPTGAEFDRERLLGHLATTNVAGALGLAMRAGTLVKETRALLGKASSKTRNEAEETARILSDVREDVKRMGGLFREVRRALRTARSDRGITMESIGTARAKSSAAADIATQAGGRMATYNAATSHPARFNKTRTVADATPVRIDRNLEDIERIALTISELLEVQTN